MPGGFEENNRSRRICPGYAGGRSQGVGTRDNEEGKDMSQGNKSIGQANEVVSQNSQLENFIDTAYIESLLETAGKTTASEMRDILDKARTRKGLKHREIASLLLSSDLAVRTEVFEIAGEIKQAI